MNTKLFVGGLPFEFTHEQLRTLFSEVGTVLSAVMIPDPKNNRTRGFGFVEMSTPEEALAAQEKLKGRTLGEKPLWVTEAREKTPTKKERPVRERFSPPNRFAPGEDRFAERPETEKSWRPPRRPSTGRGPSSPSPSRRPWDGPRRSFDRPPRPFDGPRRPFDGPRRPFEGPRRDETQRSFFEDRSPRRSSGPARPGTSGPSSRSGRPSRPFDGPGPKTSSPRSKPWDRFSRAKQDAQEKRSGPRGNSSRPRRTSPSRPHGSDTSTR